MSNYFLPEKKHGDWQDGMTECRLVANDGEVVARISYDYHSGEWRVQDTGKRYISREQAKAAAERAA